MKRVKKWFKKHTPSLLIGVFLFSAIFALYFYRLDSLTAGFSSAENKYAEVALNSGKTLVEPILGLHKLAYSLLHLVFDGVSVRFVSAVMSLVIILSFYLVAVQWQTRRVAILATLLLASSSWLLNVGRSGLPLVSYLLWVPILAVLYWSVKNKRELFQLYFWAISFSISIYIPGMLWFVTILAFTQRKRLRALFKKSPREHIAISWLLLIVLVIPFFMLIISNPLDAILALGIPVKVSQLTNAPREFIYSLFDIFFYGRSSVFRLGHLPYLDIVSGLLFIIGLYRIRFNNSKKMLKAASLILLVWIIGISFGTINIVILMPVIYFIIGSGISFILLQWLTVFPVNLYARATGLIAIYLIVGAVSVHHIQRYFVAWSQNPQVNAVFSDVNDRIE